MQSPTSNTSPVNSPRKYNKRHSNRLRSLAPSPICLDNLEKFHESHIVDIDNFNFDDLDKEAITKNPIFWVVNACLFALPIIGLVVYFA
ncbi:nucleolar phosphoprotein [Acrasis kona]|uniref:Nucleolar phosphoprotein n=1 Tax=Acrasis kona TaxID=1008807 RepID=A0AAW2YM68_9EUKA